MERKTYPSLKEWALRIGLAAGIGAGTFACKQPETQAAQPPTPVAKVELSVVKREPVVTVVPREPVLPSPQAPTPTPTEVKPTPTPEPRAASTPEIVKEQPCAILPPEYCSQAERVQITRDRIAGGKLTETYVAFNFPPEAKNVPFFVPVDGRILDIVKESGAPFSGFTAILRKPDPPGGAYIVTGDLRFDIMPSESMPQQKKDPKKGSIMGYINNTGIKNYGATVLVTVTKKSPEGAVTDEDALRELLPDAYKKPIKQVVLHEGPGKPNVSISYDSNPPQ